MRYFLLSVVVTSLFAATASADIVPPKRNPLPVKKRVRDPVERAWKTLPSSKSGCESYDYWPDGGMRNFYCHARTVISWQTLMKLSPHEPFLSGPHSRQKLDLDAKKDFGRYNPEFVRWLKGALIPATKSATFKEKTKSTYEKYVRDLARLYWKVSVTLDSDRDRKRAQARKLANRIKEGKVDWSTFPEFESLIPNADPNLQRSAALFWLRRELDETAPLFKENLKVLLQTYDGAWLSTN